MILIFLADKCYGCPKFFPNFLFPQFFDDYELEDDRTIIVALNDFFGVDCSLRVWPEVLGSRGINRWYCETNIDQRYISVGNALCDFNALN